MLEDSPYISVLSEKTSPKIKGTSPQVINDVWESSNSYYDSEPFSSISVSSFLKKQYSSVHDFKDSALWRMSSNSSSFRRLKKDISKSNSYCEDTCHN